MAGDGRMPAPSLTYPAPASPPGRAFAANVAAALQAATPRFDQVAAWSGVASPQETGTTSLSWLVGYAPADAPRFALAVVVEASDGGAAVTLPIAQRTLAAIK
jgi:hypothetical protein